MFPENLLSHAKFLICSGAAAAATTDADGAVIDMGQDDGYDGICLIGKIGDVTVAATPNLKLMGSAFANGSSPSIEAQTGAIAASDGTAQDNKLMILDVRCPANRYVFSRLSRTGANVVIECVNAVLYKSRRMPVVQGTDVVVGVYAFVLSG